jgi:hypothetical protein
MNTTSRIRLLSLGLALAAALGGCATPGKSNQGMVTYETNPEGAKLFEGSVALGDAPVTRTYTGDGKSPQITTPEVTAVWPSGAKTTFWTKIDPGSDRVATLERPAKAANLQMDLDNAAKFAKAREQEKRRENEDLRRSIARDSARCKQQQTSGNVATNDC